MAYTPTAWETGDVITKAKLNKMEQGIADASTTDSTLAQTGKAADAKATADAIDSLYDSLPSTTVSGDILEMPNTESDSPVSVSGSFDARQSGTGTPSPTNIREFIDADEVNFFISKKNLYAGSYGNLAYDGGKIKTSASYRGIWQRVKGGHYYTVSRKTIDTGRFRLCCTADEPANNVPAINYTANDSAYSKTILVPEGYNYIFVYLSNQSETVNISNYQIELGQTATEFEANTTAITQIDLGENVGGGTIQIDRRGNWAVTKKKAYVVFDGTENWSKHQTIQTNGHYFMLATALPFKKFAAVVDWADIGTTGNWLDKSDTAATSSKANSYWWNTGATGFRVIYGDPEQAMTLDDFKAQLALTPLVIVGDIETEGQLTGTVNPIEAQGDTNYLFSEADSISATYVCDVENEISEVDAKVSSYDVSDNQLLGNICVRAAKTVNFSDGTQPINEWYLLQDTEQNFYMSKDLKSKKYLFHFDPPTSNITGWSMGIDSNNNIIAIIQAAGLSGDNNLDDSVRTVNPRCWLASENYTVEHEIDFENSFKPVGWLGNYGWCVLPNKTIVMCEYTRPKVATANVWKISGDITDPANWTITWSHAIVQTDDTSGMKHCHCVQYDFYTGVVYFGTGDSDVGSWIYHSTDNGATWTLTYGPNKKKCRMLTFVFTANKVYWASDSYDATNHYFFVADRVNDVIDVENAAETALGAVNKQACYGCAYLQDLDLIVMMDRNDTTVSDPWSFALSGYDLGSGQVVQLGTIAPATVNAGFRCPFIEWYPLDNHILTGFDPSSGPTGVSTNQNAVCGNPGGSSGNGSARINNLVLSVYKKADGTYAIRFSTLYL